MIIAQDEVGMAELKRLLSRMKAAAKGLRRDLGPMKSASYSEADVLKMFWSTEMLQLLRKKIPYGGERRKAVTAVARSLSWGTFSRMRHAKVFWLHVSERKSVQLVKDDVSG